MGPRAGLDAGARRKILCPCQGSNPDRPACSRTLYCLSYRGSLPTQDGTTQKDAEKLPCLGRDSNPRSQYQSDQDPRLRSRGPT
jgi:hypothetical protein